MGVRGNTSDLEAQPFYTWIKKTYPWHVVGQLAGLFLFGGLPALVWAGALRIAWVYHITWFVNSASHVWGRQSYNTGVALPHRTDHCSTCCLDNDREEQSGYLRGMCDAGHVMAITQPQAAKDVLQACIWLSRRQLLARACERLDLSLLALSTVYCAQLQLPRLHCEHQATILICALAGCCVPCHGLQACAPLSADCTCQTQQAMACKLGRHFLNMEVLLSIALGCPLQAICRETTGGLQSWPSGRAGITTTMPSSSQPAMASNGGSSTLPGWSSASSKLWALPTTSSFQQTSRKPAWLSDFLNIT